MIKKIIIQLIIPKYIHELVNEWLMILTLTIADRAVVKTANKEIWVINEILTWKQPSFELLIGGMLGRFQFHLIDHVGKEAPLQVHTKQ
jgi:hypothetical protein